ncbi:MAG TPA: hypothetical protein PLV06_05420 [Bacteroidales bacterium]|nr:hypothetical protein [Bacteroidales bacterium]HPF03830.1 hypothetical protein [Bacteroidales bacterium]HPR11804.1 hypothetical protein [Bacteroidales bacterium]HRW84047.1 hypothetical protein [Bacteroidales bacterium]
MNTSIEQVSAQPGELVVAGTNLPGNGSPFSLGASLNFRETARYVIGLWNQPEALVSTDWYGTQVE